MYKDNMVVALKCNGKILREDKNIVYIPFGEEYSIYFKNLNCKKAKVKVSIDGQDVLNGNDIIINENNEFNLERFINSLTEGNKFKFIQKTEKIQNYRGDKIDDGIIRIEFVYEKQKKYIKETNWNINTSPFKFPTICYDPSPYKINSDILYGNNVDCNLTSLKSEVNSFIPLSDEGITTMGSISNQEFKTSFFGDEEDEKYVITFKLKGYTKSGEKINEPFTTKTPKTCNICGTNNKNINKYCYECGTYLK